MAVYLQNVDIVTFYDLRRVVMLLTDDGEGDALALADLATNDILTGAILWACGEIDMKAAHGRRYAPADLETLAADVSRKGATLRKMTADLAYGFLMQRRGQTENQMRELAPNYDLALASLEELYNGSKVFNIDSNLGATLPTTRRLGKLANLSSHMNQLFGHFDDCRFPSINDRCD